MLPEYCFGPNQTFHANGTLANQSISHGFSVHPAYISSFNDNGKLANQPNTALMCTILCLGTFLGAYYLRIFRNSHYLGRSARRAFGDFGVPLSIVTFVMIDYLAGVKTEKLLVPEGLSPTVDRSWFVDLNDNVPPWMACACCVPALLVYILVFMETQISELVLCRITHFNFNFFQLLVIQLLIKTFTSNQVDNRQEGAQASQG